MNGTLSFTSMNQNDALIPWTTNRAIANPTVGTKISRASPALPRTTAEAEVHGVNALVNLTSRPNRVFGLTARYRFNDHKNLTPPFDATEYVRFDAVPEETGGMTEQFDITENTFDLNSTFNVVKYTAFRIGYKYDTSTAPAARLQRHDGTTLSARRSEHGQPVHDHPCGIYEYTVRKGSGFSQASIEDGGAQPGLRYYDESDRDKNKGTILFVLNPVQMVDVTSPIGDHRRLQRARGTSSGCSTTEPRNTTPA